MYSDLRNKSRNCSVGGRFLLQTLQMVKITSHISARKYFKAKIIIIYSRQFYRPKLQVWRGPIVGYPKLQVRRHPIAGSSKLQAQIRSPSFLLAFLQLDCFHVCFQNIKVALRCSSATKQCYIPSYKYTFTVYDIAHTAVAGFQGILGQIRLVS